MTRLMAPQNCTMKQPPTAMLIGRFRRLCRADMKSPLEQVTMVRRGADIGGSDE